ncbi:AAA family ATPase [Candidatus Bipolaricaulota bacterium]|nr:AAA family ATPase [Candidatus Bipolaricaulota bacterium]
MSRELYFRSLELHRFPGFRPSDGFSLSDFTPGVNVIYGPNGSGKTTVARALQCLLWPGSSPEVCHVNGNFKLEKNEWFVENENGRCKYSRNGAETDGFTFNIPPLDQSDRYYLALHNLLQEQTTNMDFAEIIARESAGGYDVPAVEDELDFRIRPSNAGRRTDERAKRKVKEVEKLRSDVSELHEEYQALDRLKEELQQARRSKRRADFFDDLIDYRKRSKELNSLRDQLDSFPDPVEKITGDEKERLENINEKISRIEIRKGKNKEELENLSSTLKSVSLPEEGVSSGLIKELKERADRLEDLEEDLNEVNREIAASRRVKKNVLAGFSGEFSDAELNELDFTGIQDLAEFSREAEDVRTGLKAYRQLTGWLREIEAPELTTEELRDGKRYLEEWLRAVSYSRDGISAKLVSRTLGALNLIGAALLAPLVNPLFSILVIPAGGFVWLDWHFNQSTDVRKTNKKRYLELELESPDRWNEEIVRKLLRKLSRQEAESILTRKRKEFLAAKEEELSDLQEKKAELVVTKEKLVDKYGVAPDIDEGKFHWLLERLNRWKSADEDLEGLAGKKEKLVSTISELREELSEKLKTFGYEKLEESAGFRGALRDLNQRKERFNRARDRLREVKSRKEELNNRLQELKQEKENLFTELGLEVGDRQSLYRYFELKDDYRELASRARKQEAVCNSRLKELRDRACYEEDLPNKGLSKLKRQRESLKERAGNRDRIFEKINRIEERIRGRKNKRELEMARAEMNRALGELENQLHSDYGSMAGNVLFNYLRDEVFSRSRPRVFSRGGEIFTRITRGGNRLVLAETDPPAFKAVDTESGEARSLEELSSGTRLQLLMSVRMAFVEQQEDGVKLPLLMDEVLANSDDVKASEVIDVALEFSRAGRQIFYFTAQGDEVAKWRDKLAEMEEVSGQFIDLSEARGLTETIKVPEDVNFDPDNGPPPPGDMCHGDYGEALGITSFDPAKGPGSAHLWYIVGDVEILYRLLSLEIDSWGRFKALTRENASILDRFDEVELVKIRDLGQALERYVDAWRVGRNRPIDRTVLERSGAITENFMDEVVELVRETNGEPEQVINRLEKGEVPGFRTDKKNELEDFLEENDYIKDGDKLSREEIKTRLLSTFDPGDPENPGQTISRLVARLTEF